MSKSLALATASHPARHAAASPCDVPRGTAVGRGLSNAEIGEDLFMSHATAKTHVSRLLAKLYVRDRAQLVVLAYESGVIVPGAAS